MTGYLPGEPSSHEGGGPNTLSPDKQEEVAGRWYMSRKEIEENSPSRGDFIDLKRETYLRKSYCTFLQDLGMRLKVPQVTIATAIIFCHRFFLRQSHAKNDRRTIATVCMFLAGKVEETPRPIKDVILVSYEIINKKDPAAAQRIKQKEVYEQQKELILLGERVVLATLGFDLNVLHPYKPLVEAIKKFKVAQNALAQVAWNFVNDGLRTSLCLQFKPHHIAAGAIFLAAKFLKVKLPSDGEKVWWQEFDVTPRQLEEVSNQMLELYEQNRVPPSQGSEVESSQNHRTPAKINDEEHTPNSGIVMKPGSLRQSSSRSAPDHSDPPRSVQHQSNENGSVDMGGSVITDHKVDEETKAENARDETTEAKSTFHKSGGVRMEKLLEIHRAMGQVELNCDLVALDVGETYEMRNNLVVRPFKTHHVIPSQGYVIYSVRNKLKKQYIHLKGKQIEKLKKSGVEITDIILSPEVAFTGDTNSDFMLDPRNADALRAKILITEATFLDEGFSIEHARQHGHTHLSELIEHAKWIRNKAILLTHFSSRYNIEDIRQAVSKLQSRVIAKVVPLTEGFKSMHS